MTVDADLDRIADIRALVREVALSTSSPRSEMPWRTSAGASLQLTT
jgi:hypothetical protein